MHRKIIQTVRVNKLLHKLMFKEATQAEVFLTEYGEFILRTDGHIRNIKILYSGRADIQSNLPNGYHLYVGRGIIRIRNIMGNPLPEDGIILRFNHGFNIKTVSVRNWFFKTIKAKINKEGLSYTIGLSETKFEDDTYIISDIKSAFIAGYNQRNKNVNNVITGLYTNVPFASGYTGFYHYYPAMKVFMTGSNPSKTSSPLINGKKNVKSIKKIKRFAEKVLLEMKKGLLSDNLKLDKVEEIESKKVDKSIKDVDYRAVIDLQRPISKRALSRGSAGLVKKINEVVKTTKGGKY